MNTLVRVLPVWSLNSIMKHHIQCDFNKAEQYNSIICVVSWCVPKGTWELPTRQLYCLSYTRPEIKRIWYFSLQPILNIKHHHNMRQCWGTEYEVAWSMLIGGWNMDTQISDLLCVQANTAWYVKLSSHCHQNKRLIIQRCEFCLLTP